MMRTTVLLSTSEYTWPFDDGFSTNLALYLWNNRSFLFLGTLVTKNGDMEMGLSHFKT